MVFAIFTTPIDPFVTGIGMAPSRSLALFKHTYTYTGRYFFNYNYNNDIKRNN